MQLLLVHESRQAEVEQRLAKLVQALRYGDPMDPNTFVGPVISEEAARRIETWISEAVASWRPVPGGRYARRRGGRAHAADPHQRWHARGLQRDLRPGGLHRAIPDPRASRGPRQRHAFRPGHRPLHQRLGDALAAASELEVGGVHVNETSSSRVDLMPYGGSRTAVWPRRPRYAVHEMTEERVVTFTTA